MSVELVAWLLEQIAKDEHVAKALPESPRLGGRPSRPGETYRGPSHGLGTFIRTISPARVLAECEAKRQIIEDCARYVRDGEVQVSDGLAARALYRLALPYAGREGYREEWRPSSS